MKDTKRALRRYQKLVQLKKRLNAWLNSGWCDHREITKYKEKAIKGECLTFLRTTARPCNCPGCSAMNKHVREQRQYIVKQAFEDIAEYNGPVV